VILRFILKNAQRSILKNDLVEPAAFIESKQDDDDVNSWLWSQPDSQFDTSSATSTVAISSQSTQNNASTTSSLASQAITGPAPQPEPSFSQAATEPASHPEIGLLSFSQAVMEPDSQLEFDPLSFSQADTEPESQLEVDLSSSLRPLPEIGCPFITIDEWLGCKVCLYHIWLVYIDVHLFSPVNSPSNDPSCPPSLEQLSEQDYPTR
jgi:hypothetical protein